jgi:hypothetical protein
MVEFIGWMIVLVDWLVELRCTGFGLGSVHIDLGQDGSAQSTWVHVRFTQGLHAPLGPGQIH